MGRRNIKMLKYLDFQKKVSKCCTTFSCHFIPDKITSIEAYNCTVSSFINAATYPVRYVDEHKENIVGFDTENPNEITFKEYLENDAFVADMLGGWKDSKIAFKNEIEIIVFGCSSCNKRIVMDGNHRIVLLGSNKQFNTNLKVYELMGERWPPRTPDFNVVCKCARK